MRQTQIALLLHDSRMASVSAMFENLLLTACDCSVSVLTLSPDRQQFSDDCTKSRRNTETRASTEEQCFKLCGILSGIV